jgi:hypothetical protein
MVTFDHILLEQCLAFPLLAVLMELLSTTSNATFSIPTRVLFLFYHKFLIKTFRMKELFIFSKSVKCASRMENRYSHLRSSRLFCANRDWFASPVTPALARLLLVGSNVCSLIRL